MDRLFFKVGPLLFLAAFPAHGQDNPPVAQPVIAQPASTPDQPPVAERVDLTPPAAASTNAPGLVILNPAETEFNRALVLYNAGQFADAITAFSGFISLYPQDRHREEALYRLAESYRSLGRAKDALAAYTYQVKHYPDGPLKINAQLRRGALLFDAGQLSEAIAPLREVAAQGNPELQEAAHYLLGRALLATKNEAEARPLLQALIDARSKYGGDSAQALAEVDDEAGNHTAALALWQSAFDLIKEPAVKATIAARGGWTALDVNQLAPAEKFFLAARQLDPSGGARKVANTGLLRVYFQQKRYADWVALYNQEQDKLLNSGRAEVLYDLGHSQFVLKHWADSAMAFDQYLREFPSDTGVPGAAYERFLAGTQMDRTRTVGEAEAFLKAYPQSPFRARVQLIEAQELSAEKKFAAALPLWQSLAQEKGDDADWPHPDILLQLARSQDELQNWAAAATAYQNYLDAAGKISSRQMIEIQSRIAVCLQKSDQPSAAVAEWEAVRSEAPAGSKEQEIALESLGLLYAKGGPDDQGKLAATFRTLLDQFPQTPLRALAAFTVGDDLFRRNDYAGAEKYLLEARQWDAKAWMQPATQRLALGAYGLKDAAKARAYEKQYDDLPLPTEPIARDASRLPAALYYWLAEQAQDRGNYDEAEGLYFIVTRHPNPGDLLAGAWWQLGQVQMQQKEWPDAVVNYGNYRKAKPDSANASAVLLALGRAQLGAGDTTASKALAQQVLLQEPEGLNSAAARMLLGETAFATHSYAEAARTFGTLAVLFDDPKITPQAMSRAADAYAAAGDNNSATTWRQKLQAKYPNYQPTAYL